ncbi:MAG TPA: hypothetical protein VF889_00120, partial [Bacteroidota bacterium]
MFTFFEKEIDRRHYGSKPFYKIDVIQQAEQQRGIVLENALGGITALLAHANLAGQHIALPYCFINIFNGGKYNYSRRT